MEPVDKSVVQARSACEKESTKHIAKANIVIVVTVVVMVFFVGIITDIYLFKKENTIDYRIYFSMIGLLIMFFGVFISLYRYHTKEAVKYYHLAIGFMRIEIAIGICNEDAALKMDLVLALSNAAFNLETNNFFGNKKKIESPVPGHIGFDSMTFLLNRLIAIIEKLEKR